MKGIFGFTQTFLGSFLLVMLLAVIATFTIGLVAGIATGLGGTALALGNIEAGNYAGPKPGWSQMMYSDNPADLYGLSKAEAETIAQFFGFVGHDVAGDYTETNFMRFDGTSAPTLTNYADMPIGTVIICPKLTAPRIYIHKAQSTPGVVGDWYYIEGTQAS